VDDCRGDTCVNVESLVSATASISYHIISSISFAYAYLPAT
jgi:hypothetical protein